MRRAFMTLLALALFAAAGYVFLFRDGGESPQAHTPAARGALEDSSAAPIVSGGTAPSPLAVRLDGAVDPIQIDFKKPPKSAVVFDQRAAGGSEKRFVR